MKIAALLLLLSLRAFCQSPPPKDISGTWIAKMESPMMGETEFVYEIKIAPNGKITDLTGSGDLTYFIIIGLLAVGAALTFVSRRLAAAPREVVAVPT